MSVNTINTHNKEIIHLDFKNFNPDMLITELDIARNLIATKKHNSVLIIADITGTSFDPKILIHLKFFMDHNRKYVKFTAMLGVTGMRETIVNQIIRFTGRTNIKLFNNYNEAENFLVNLE
ncbi:MAG: hypothetical protein HQK51_01430 [Oligoflexia bacterium]|nr:hypothetical protein [Oligoflexia bacterium]